MSLTIKLSKPISAHGSDVDTLELREPTAGDVMELGYPFIAMVGDEGGGTGIEMRPKVVARYVALLGKIPPSSIAKMEVSDLMACQAAVMGFFVETAASN